MGSFFSHGPCFLYLMLGVVSVLLGAYNTCVVGEFPYDGKGLMKKNGHYTKVKFDFGMVRALGMGRRDECE